MVCVYRMFKTLQKDSHRLRILRDRKMAPMPLASESCVQPAPSHVWRRNVRRRIPWVSAGGGPGFLRLAKLGRLESGVECNTALWHFVAKANTMNASQFLLNHGYLTVFFGLLLEYLGLPIPGELILLFFGALAYWGKLELWVVVVTGLAALLLGDHFWYLAGRRGGRNWLRWLCRATLGSAQCMSRTEYFFQRYGPAALLFAKFVPGFRTFATPMAGMTGISYRRFLGFDLMGSLLWVAGFTCLGFLMATRLWVIAARLQRLGSTVASILVLAVLTVLVSRLRKRLKYGEPNLDS